MVEAGTPMSSPTSNAVPIERIQIRDMVPSSWLIEGSPRGGSSIGAPAGPQPSGTGYLRCFLPAAVEATFAITAAGSVVRHTA